MRQTRLQSLREAVMNATVGFPLAWFIHFALISHMILWLAGFGISQTGPIMAAAVTFVYWVVSVARVYSVRRYYNSKKPERACFSQYIVCAATLVHGHVHLSIRHADKFIRRDIIDKGGNLGHLGNTGFVDNHGMYHNRVDALAIAKKANQIRDDNVGGGHKELFSEMLY